MQQVQLISDILAEPKESLEVEIKEWLDLSGNKNHRAALAKEIIALANHGGGFLIVGLHEMDDGTYKASSDEPASWKDWSGDSIQSIIARYIDPQFQCKTDITKLPRSDKKVAVINVPGGHRVPARAKSGAPDGKTISPNRIYVRRPGPNSEEPQSAVEWDRLFDQIVKNRRDELLDSMRAIINGVTPTFVQEVPPLASDSLQEFIETSDKHWKARVRSLPDDSSPRFPHGYYDCAFEIAGDFSEPSMRDLRDMIRTSHRNHSGWSAFPTLNREPYAPKIVDEAIEFWRGPEPDGSTDTPHRHDFWRISPKGLMFTRRGYSEDGLFEGMKPGVFFDISTPTRRLGDAVMQAVYLASALNVAGGDVRCIFRFNGLKGRELTTKGNPRRLLMEGYRTEQSSYEAETRAPLHSLPDALPELVDGVLAPLYEHFDFFPLPKKLVEEELADLLRHRF